MEEKKYPMFINTKEDFDYIIKNFPKEMWKDDILNLYADGLQFEPLHRVKLENDKFVRLEDYTKIEVSPYFSDPSTDYNYLGGYGDGRYEYREFKDNVIIEGELVTRPGSKLDSFGLDIVYVQDLLFGDMKRELAAFEAKVKQDQKKLQEVIENGTAE